MASSRELSVVVPVYNEAPVLAEFHRRLSIVLNSLGSSSEVIYVNDGSTDATLDGLTALREADERVAVIDLSRNFGKEIAITAGLDGATGDAVIVIDADLQDPPELIPKLIERWREGHDVVYAQRSRRHGETLGKRVTAHLFYRVIRRMGSVRIPADTGDFRLLSRRAVEALSRLQERHRFMKGLFSWIGFSQVAVPYERDPRYAGTSKWSYWQLWNFAVEGITSFSTLPLKLATYVGLTTAIGSLIYGVWIILQKILIGNPVPGYPSLMVVILFLGGIQLITLGLIGEYLARVFNETKQRPLYLIRQVLPAKLPGGSRVQPEGNNARQ